MKDILRVKNLNKSYKNFSLTDVSFSLSEGCITGFIGINGAGKTTTLRTILDLAKKDSGNIQFFGLDMDKNEQQIKNRIGVVLDDGCFYEELSMAEMKSILASAYTDWSEQNFKHYMDMFSLDPKRKINTLSKGMKMKYALTLALAHNAELLIMDEPTSALSQSEVKVLFKVIEQLKRRGVTIIYISHRLEELMEIGDNITIFRDGRFISERHVSDASVPWIIEQMVGDKKKHFDYQPAPKGNAVLDVKGLTALHPSGGYKLNDVTFTLSKGEVIGIYGLLGAGRTELFKGLVGLMPCQRGEVHLNGESIGKSRFQQRLKKGLALVPEDRQGEGVVQMMSIQANMTLSDFSLQGFRRAWRWLNPQKEETCVKEMIQQLAIKVSDATLPITSLSGGNQQKVVLGKALMTQPQVVFLDEPTRGIDVGAKTDVYHLIGKMAQQGLAVMFSSSELDEVMALADRILVMADGRITADLPRHAVTREQLIAASTPQD